MTPTETHIRSATIDDRKIIRRTIYRARLNPLDLAWQAFLIAEDGQGRFLGCVQLKHHNDGSKELASLYILPTHRGRGIAAKLIEAIMARAQDDLWLTCRSELVPYYERFQFYEVSDPGFMPPYFSRVWRLFRVFTQWSTSESRLAVMHWQPGSE